ncbi:NAD(P)-dependent oxidoreductase [Solirubrobacter ginsenosidimutans]|uniref:NAD(P)-dependent oxidoreductase n=1 Tax=Solirubrobacter ginsenosidimutans TaxID=490573 RepID=A0A9X3MTQ8_9ACTN|nr:NAD(P)-dependent oxidoreductase [Solirubrobacter ginsenosidimutans]MDA0162876.1 NAD(P)-dependent oxidoreductase [Solirubrobacter ginsenosidimutans]
MRILVTGSSGHLGEALCRVLAADGVETIGLDILPSPHTTVVGSVADRPLVRSALDGVDAILHAATLHKPHVGSHTRQEFVETNITGTLTLLEEAVAAGVGRVIYTSTTSAFGRALTPEAGAPANWITEDVAPVPRNIYGVTKTAAENVCELIHRDHGLPILILRTSRFFPEADDRDEVREAFADANLKVNELLYRRADLADIVSAHRLALDRAPELGFGRYIISATTPFTRDDLAKLHENAPAVVARHAPAYADLYEQLGWRMFDTIERVYVNEAARRDLGWRPRYDFAYALERLARGEEWRSELALQVGAKGYHAESTGPYTVR